MTVHRPKPNHSRSQRKAVATVEAKQISVAPTSKFWPKWKTLSLWAVTAISGVAGVYFWNGVDSANGHSGFPLDDSWIHLTFARTLSQTGHFAYGPLNNATSGSTSPLFTVMEAVLFLVTSNEFFIAKLLSIIGFVLAVHFVFKAMEAARPLLVWMPVSAALLLIVNPRFFAASVWGMETTFAGAFIAAAAYYYEKRSWRILGIVLGLSLWCRPDLVLIPLALGIDYFLNRRNREEIEWKELLIPAISLGVAYLAFNMVLSGSPLPNTFSAKLAYYKLHHPGFWSAAWDFFTTEGKGLTMGFVIAGVLVVVLSLIRRKTIIPIYPFLLFIGFIALYAWKLPYLYQDGRYLVPACVAFVLSAAFGVGAVVEWFGQGRFVSAAAILLAVAAGMQLSGFSFSDLIEHEASQEQYINRLQVTSANWCAKNLPKDAVIATHDIGAIGFYSNRKIVDMVGLVDPQIIPHIGNPSQTIRYIRKRGATHAAVLDDWFEIVNENAVFVNAPPESERMEVFPVHDSTEMSGETVLSIHKFLRQSIASGSAEGFDQAMSEAVRLEPNNPLTYNLAGELLLELHRLPEAERMLETAVRLFPKSEMATKDLEFAKAVGKH